MIGQLLTPRAVHRLAIGTWVLAGANLIGLGKATENLGSSADLTWTIAAWAIWVTGVFLIFVPSAVGLVIVRTITPLALIGSFAALNADSVQIGTLIGFISLAAVAVIVASAELGHVCVNASAYGSEVRFLLRPPAPMIAPMFIGWLLAVAPLACLVLGLATGSVVAIIVGALTTVALVPLMILRLSKLSARWLVLVPAGLVIHDKLVLAETVMFRRNSVTDVRLAPADTESADLTGMTWGVPLQVTVDGGDKVIFNPDKQNPNGRAIHVRSMLVAPSRPALFLQSWK